MKLKLFLDKFMFGLIFLLTFTLPFDYNFNNWVLGIFYACSVILIFINRKNVRLGKNEWMYVLLISGFFILTVIGFFYSDNSNKAMALIVRTIPMLLTPLFFFSIPNFYKKFSKPLYFGLVLGCLLAAIICWGDTLIEMLSNNEPFSYLFRWRHLNHQLTEVIDVHPSYLALFVVTSIVILGCYINSGIEKRNKYLAYFLIAIFSVFLFVLLARTILCFYLLSLIVFLVIKRKFKLLAYCFTVVVFSVAVVFFIRDENNYLRNKFFNDLPILGTESRKDKRFNRLQATKYMFMRHPLLGVGTGDSQVFRQKHYLEQNDTKAYKEKFNAHNQFFEYLDSLGIIGGCFYLFLFIFLFRKAFKEKDYVFVYVITLFFVANLTESMLVRTHGVVYYSLAFSLLSLRFFCNKKSENIQFYR